MQTRRQSKIQGKKADDESEKTSTNVNLEEKTDNDNGSESSATFLVNKTVPESKKSEMDMVKKVQPQIKELSHHSIANKSPQKTPNKKHKIKEELSPSLSISVKRLSEQPLSKVIKTEAKLVEHKHSEEHTHDPTAENGSEDNAKEMDELPIEKQDFNGNAESMLVEENLIGNESAERKKPNKFNEWKKRQLENKAENKAKKLKSFFVEPGYDNTEEQKPETNSDDVVSKSSPVSDKKKRKRKKKPKVDKPDENLEPVPPQPSSKDKSISYLKSWKLDRKNWSFNKARQIWLIKNLYNTEDIDKELFSDLLDYLEKVQGCARTRILEEAQSIYKSCFPDDSDAENSANATEAPEPARGDRARLILQMLSE